MEKSRKRAERRHHTERLKKARKGYWWSITAYTPYVKTPRQLGILVNTSTVCSCWQCCNQRRNGEITIAEKRENARLPYEFEELNAEEEK